LTPVRFRLRTDAADAELIDRRAAEGDLPNLAALAQPHVTSRMETAAGLRLDRPRRRKTSTVVN